MTYEQVMLISQIIGGLSAKADNLRKVMEKATNFPDGRRVCKRGREGFKKEFASFDQMSKFAEYGFNKSHRRLCFWAITPPILKPLSH